MNHPPMQMQQQEQQQDEGGIYGDAVEGYSQHYVAASPTNNLPQDFSELHVAEHNATISSAPQRRQSGLDALALACAVENHQTTSSPSPSPPPEVSTEEGATTAGIHISQHDVLCGRGGLTNHHAGNMFFRSLVRAKQESYLLASKREKAGVAREIVDLVRSRTPRGRFLKKVPKNPNMWVEIGDRKAREKTSQALREGAPELRDIVKHTKTVVTTSSNEPTIEAESNTSTNNHTHHINHLPAVVLWNMENNAKNKYPIQDSEVVNTPLSNRARIVSDDLVVAWGHRNGVQMDQPEYTQQEQPRFILPVNEPEPAYYYASEPKALVTSEDDVYSAGSKRKSPTPCAMQEHTWEQSSSKNRGPRLKLLKSRLTEYCA